jgi:outer membrane cobalamin receptor
MVSPTRALARGNLVVLFSLLIIALPLFAESELEGVVATASRIPGSESSSPPAITVVSAEDIASRGATTVAEAIETAPGLSLNSKGPEGSQVAVSIRGSTTNQVLVLVDGHRVNDALSGLVDLSKIPLDKVERIEVMRGGASAIYGGDAVGGVVNIITKKEAFPLSLSFENGSYLPSSGVTGYGIKKALAEASASSLIDSQKLSLSWGPRLGEGALRLDGSATRAANEYGFIDSNGERRRRQNSSLLGADASLGLSLPLASGELTADLGGAYGTKGVPGSESSPTLYATQEDFSAKALVAYSAERFLSDLLSLDASLGADYSSIDYEDAEDPSQDGHHRLLSAAFDVAQRAYLSDSLTLAYGAQAAYSAAESDSLGAPARLSGGAFGEASLSFGSFSLRPSLRYDYYSDFSASDPLGGIGGAFGATYSLDRDSVLKLNVSRAYRVPTFNDLYWPAISGVEGNPSLKPEMAYEANLGFETGRDGLRSETTVYLRYSEDVILWQPGDDGVWRPSNFGAALYPGLEEEFKARIGEGFEASLGYTFLYSYVLSGGMSLSDDKRLPMTPEHSLKAVFSGGKERFSWSTTAQYAGIRYLKTANVAYLPAYFTLDLCLRWTASNSLSFYAAGDNLLDEQYAIVEGYPLPGTKLRLGAEMKL